MKDSNNSVKNDQAAITTIVGSRPPGRGRGRGEIPHGIEVLIKKAAVDGAFRRVLLKTRAQAARKIGLELTPPEIAMLDATPAAQIEAIIENTKVPDAQRQVFLGQKATVMLAAIATNCECQACRRIKGDGDDSDTPRTTRGIRPDFPARKYATKGIRPDFPTRAPPSEDTSPDQDQA